MQLRHSPPARLRGYRKPPCFAVINHRESRMLKSRILELAAVIVIASALGLTSLGAAGSAATSAHPARTAAEPRVPSPGQYGHSAVPADRALLAQGGSSCDPSTAVCGMQNLQPYYISAFGTKASPATVIYQNGSGRLLQRAYEMGSLQRAYVPRSS